MPPSMVDLDTLLALICITVLLQTCDSKLSTDFSKHIKAEKGEKCDPKAVKKSNSSSMHTLSATLEKNSQKVTVPFGV